MFLGNLDKQDTKNHFHTSDIFVNEILLIWAEINFNNSISSLEQYKTQRLWNNSLIRIDRKPVFFFREWLAKGILTVESPIKDGTCFLSYTEFLNKYHCKSCPLAFSGIIATLKTIRMGFKENIDSLETIKVESFTKAFQKTKKPSKLTYRNLVATKTEKPRASQAKWYRDCDLNREEIDCKKTFLLTRTCAKSTKIIIFQFKFLHRRLPTNSFLHKIAIKDNDLCTFCKEETDTLLHLFWQCKVTTHFWGCFFQWLQTSALIQKGSHLALTTALGLKPDSSKSNLQINFSCLMSRYYIWKCKLRDETLNLSQFLRLLKKTYEIETNGLSLQPEKWKPLLGRL